MLEFMKSHGAKSVVMTDGHLGCPHQEGGAHLPRFRIPKMKLRPCRLQPAQSDAKSWCSERAPRTTLRLHSRKSSDNAPEPSRSAIARFSTAAEINSQETLKNFLNTVS